MIKFFLVLFVSIFSNSLAALAQKDSMQPLLNKAQNAEINAQRNSDSLINAEYGHKNAALKILPSGDTTIRGKNGKMIKESKETYVKTQMEKAMTLPNPDPPQEEASSNKNYALKIPTQKNILPAGLNDWNEISKHAAEEMILKYGNPYSITEHELVWLNAGMWREIRVYKHAIRHSFPFEHYDVLQTTIEYVVPTKRVSSLTEFDGSVTFDRTQGLLSTRSDSEEHNFLELNLANEVIFGNKSAKQARKAFSDILVAALHEKKPEYMQRLSFLPQEKTADPDKTTIKLNTPKDMKIIKN